MAPASEFSRMVASPRPSGNKSCLSISATSSSRNRTISLLAFSLQSLKFNWDSGLRRHEFGMPFALNLQLPGGVSMNTIWQDVRYGLRMLVKNPGISLLAVAALALGIGANAAIFSLADPLLLRPEPFPNLSRLVLIFNKVEPFTDENSMLPADYEAIRVQSSSFEQLAAYSPVD